MNEINDTEAVEIDLVYNIYEAFSVALKNNIVMTFAGKTLPIRSFFQEPQKAEELLDAILQKENNGASERKVIDIFQIQKTIKKMKMSQALLDSPLSTDSEQSEGNFFEDIFSLKTAS